MLKDNLDNNELTLSNIEDIIGVKRHTLNARLKTRINNNDIYKNQSDQIILTPEQAKEIIKENITDKAGKVIYLGNLKSGVGKSTIAALLANTLSAIGIKTCLIDLDPQARLTDLYHIYDNEECFSNFIKKETSLDEVVFYLNDYLDIIPSSIYNMKLDSDAIMLKSTDFQAIRDKYDVVIIDTPPYINSINKTIYSFLGKDDHVLIPIINDQISVNGAKLFYNDISSNKSLDEISQKTNLSVFFNKINDDEENYICDELRSKFLDNLISIKIPFSYSIQKGNGMELKHVDKEISILKKMNLIIKACTITKNVY